MGVVCLSDAETSEPRMLLDARAVTALRTGAVAAVAAQALARAGAATVGVIGCGLHGAWAARCLAAAGYGPGRLLRPARRRRPPRSRTSSAGARATAPRRSRATSSAASRPATSRSSTSRDLRPGLHLNMLGADGPGKAEATRRGGRALRAVLRRVGAGVARRRADRRGRGRRRRARRRHRPRRRARRRRARPRRTPTP